MSDLAPLLDLLRCPKCRAKLVHDGERLVCTGARTRLAYPIRDGIPAMIVEDAEELSEDEWKDVMVRVSEATG